MKNSLVVTVLVVFLAGGAGFFGGMQYQKTKTQAGFASGNRMMLRNGQNGQAKTVGFRPVNGEIISSDEESITVKMSDGSSKIILLSDKTTINKAGVGAKEDLKTGETVAVFGQENSDGSITAQSVQLNPQEQRIFQEKVEE